MVDLSVHGAGLVGPAVRNKFGCFVKYGGPRNSVQIPKFLQFFSDQSVSIGIDWGRGRRRGQEKGAGEGGREGGGEGRGALCLCFFLSV